MAEPISTSTCSFELDPRGFVRATMFQGTQMDLADAKANLEATVKVTGGRRSPVLVDSRGLKSQSKSAREYFVGEEAFRATSAVALLVGSPVSRVIGNFFLRQQDHRSPTRLFTDEAEAVEWLLMQLR